jgi:hypothetical protein
MVKEVVFDVRRPIVVEHRDHAEQLVGRDPQGQRPSRAEPHDADGLPMTERLDLSLEAVEGGRCRHHRVSQRDGLVSRLPEYLGRARLHDVRARCTVGVPVEDENQRAEDPFLFPPNLY